MNRIVSNFLPSLLLCGTVFGSALLSPTTYAASDPSTPLLERANVQKFIDRMVTKHDFYRDELVAVISQLSLREPKKKAAQRTAKMKNPPESRPWAEYRIRHVKPNIIKRGVEFWKKHKVDLERAEQEYGVPVEVILGVLGVETRYGSYQGSDLTINALATFAFNYPSRERFFTAELEAFLLLAREEQRDPFSYKGSYAGAMGMPQFMPSNYRKLAVDFDDDGQKDIWGTPADAIGSIANYLKHHGWKRGKPIATVASVDERGNAPSASYASNSPNAQSTFTWIVKPGETLWRVAKETHDQYGLTVGQMMDKIYTENPHAFSKGNKTRLMKGAKLKFMPAGQTEPSSSVATNSAYKSLLIKKKIKPKHTVQTIRSAGVQFDPNHSANHKALLMELKGEHGLEYWVGFHNFYVISRYNPRTLYTMAVFQLSEEIRKAYEQQNT